MKEENINPQAQLALITSILQDSRESLKNSSFPYIVWGGACSTGTAISYILGYTGNAKFILPLWIAIMLSATFFVFRHFRKKQTPNVKYFSDRIYGTLWGGITVFGIGLWLASVLFKTAFSIQEGMAILSSFIGLGYLVSSVLTKYRALLILGIFWGIGGMACLVIPAQLVPALVGAMAFFFEFIPGLVMYKTEITNKADTGKNL